MFNDNILELKKSIVDKILSNMPDGPDIDVISEDPICFTISVSDLTKDKILSPKMYNYEYLISILKEYLLSAPLEDIENRLKQIVKSGYLVKSNERIKIPEDIIRSLAKQLNKINKLKIKLEIKEEK